MVILLAVLIATHAQLSAHLADARAAFARMVAASAAAAKVVEGLHLDERLQEDAQAIDAAIPVGYNPADWDETLANIVALDTNLVEQLTGTPSHFTLETGLHERLLRSPTDGALDSVATYVPAGTPQSVAIVLHGNPQSESELLAQPYLRRIADETQTILVAPYGRGSYDFHGTAGSDLYGLMLLLKRMPQLAPLKFYLVGYSMGGFTAYMLGPTAPIAWSAVLDISGSLVGSASNGVLQHWQHMRIYVVHGGNDTSIPTRFSRDTAIFLYQSGIPVSYYEVGGAGHALRELAASVDTAWHDMMRGIVRDGPAAQLAHDMTRSAPPNPAPPSKVDRP